MLELKITLYLSVWHTFFYWTLLFLSLHNAQCEGPKRPSARETMPFQTGNRPPDISDKKGSGTQWRKLEGLGTPFIWVKCPG